MEVQEDPNGSNSQTQNGQNEADYDEFKQRWMQEQLNLKQQLITHDDFDWYIPDDNNSNNNETEKRSLELIGGVDISFIKDNNVDACASLIVMSYPSFEIVYKDFQMVKLELPYIPSFLGFREVPFLLQLINNLKTTHPELLPQVILVDGNGMLHPRGFGTACHLGVLSGIPTIGIGKTFFVVENVMIEDYKRMEKTLQPKQSINVVGSSGTVWGALFRSTKDSVKSITISIGHKISLETALKVVSVCSLYRIPEPVRQADLLSRDYIRQHPL